MATWKKSASSKSWSYEDECKEYNSCDPYLEHVLMFSKGSYCDLINHTVLFLF
ncbi:13972_t:CDS:2 [Gigaspora margarita]|uniref:13972_t:CDS:1 n=1 Tax=Gigaspora margarita TaxID=4874 RepID=A0ABN7UXE1_GIGMA|nr:13972_t:CDS:2 [Gigaspora margarita]